VAGVADPKITIDQLALNDQTAYAVVTFTGPPDATGSSRLVIYDATGAEVWSQPLYEETLGTIWQHEANIDLPIDTLGDGDFGLWVTAWMGAADGEPLDNASQGLSFMVGRGRAYKSGEAVHEPDMDQPVIIHDTRLEGTWVFIDMVNHSNYDVSVVHGISVLLNGSEIHTATGEELVNASATQQAHHLLPEGLADGDYTVHATVQAEGSQVISPGQLFFEVHDGAITVTP